VPGVAEPRGGVALARPAEHQRAPAVGHEGKGRARPFDELLQELSGGEPSAVPEPDTLAAPAPLRLPHPAASPGPGRGPAARLGHDEAPASEEREDRSRVAYS